MEGPDVVVVGGGISGLAFAWKASQAGRTVTVLERQQRVGGCLHSERTSAGYWFELGAHTAYNSYGGFLAIAEGAGLLGKLVERGPARATFGFLRGGDYKWLTPPKVLLELDWLEAALHAPLGLFASKAGLSVAASFSKLVGPGNYAKVLGPFLSAVPSQSADGFPAEGPGSLFKKRPRRKDVLRSFGFEGGLQSVCDAAAASPGVTVVRGVTAASLARSGDGFAVTSSDGRRFEAPLAAVAVGPDLAAPLLREAFPEVARAIAEVKTVGVDSVGVVLPRAKAWMPPCAFVVPVGDAFFSCVTRDPFPDQAFRAFAFHFRPGMERAARLRRITEVLRVSEADFVHLAEKRLVLPAPEVGHGARVEAIDRALAGQRLALTGNYFEGLAIEDCVLRSNAEWSRTGGALEKS